MVISRFDYFEVLLCRLYSFRMLMKAIKEVFVFLNCFLCSIFNNTINLCFNIATNFQFCRVSFCVANGKESSVVSDSIPFYKLHCVPRHIWGHGFVKVGDTDLKWQFRVSWCEIINDSIITII